MKGRLDVDRLTPQHTGWRQGPAIPMLGAAMDGRMDEWTVDTRLDECMGGWVDGSMARESCEGFARLSPEPDTDNERLLEALARQKQCFAGDRKSVA